MEIASGKTVSMNLKDGGDRKIRLTFPRPIWRVLSGTLGS